MALVLNGSGSITGLSAGGLPDGSVTADDIASTLDLSGKTITNMNPSGIYLGGTGAANYLDDYEEGTFTPTLPAGSTGVTYVTQFGKYTKIGNVVYIHVFLRISAVSSVPGGAGGPIIAGLPFTSGTNTSKYEKLSTQWNGSNFGGTVGITQVNPNSTTITATGCTNNAGFVDSTPSSVWDAGGNWVACTGFYYV
jgi:hypothetical protein